RLRRLGMTAGSADVPRATADMLGTVVLASAAEQASGVTPADVALPWVASLRAMTVEHASTGRPTARTLTMFLFCAS
ncbi:hypothetical protein ACLBX9_00470, partial [Methylobacterium sp. A49B]